MDMLFFSFAPLFAVTAGIYDRLAVAGSFFGTFLIAMAAIFAVLMLTKKISAWIDSLRK